jgi:tRNA pseudouridine38-40 synthase
MKKKFKGVVEYLGAGFHGMQKQRELGLPTIQGEIERVLQILLRTYTPIDFAGRTDAGVHAKGQVVGFEVDCVESVSEHKLLCGLNYFLNQKNISFLDLCAVDISFSPRFDAKWRRYEYHIINRKSGLGLEKGLAWHIYDELDIGLMRDVCEIFIGKHDFSAFRSKFCNAKSPVKTLDNFEIEQVDGTFEQRLIFHVQAQSFLHNMVRYLVGSVVDIGRGRLSFEDVQNALETGNKDRVGQVAPPFGLYFCEVGY